MLVELITGPELKIKLKKKNIQQKDICEDLGYNQTTVSRYFTGIQQMPARFIVDVAVYAGFDIFDLIHPDDVESTLHISDEGDILSEESSPYTADEKYNQRKEEIKHEINDLIKSLQNIKKFRRNHPRKSPEKYP